MFNQTYTILYNQTANSPSGVPIGITKPYVVPSVLASVKESLVLSDTPQAHDEFAIKCLKIVDGSLFKDDVKGLDSRITYDIGFLAVDVVDFSTFITQWLSLPPAAIQFMLRSELYMDAYRSSISQDSVSALILSYVERVFDAHVGIA